MKILQEGPIVAYRRRNGTEEITRQELRYEIRDQSENVSHSKLWITFQLHGGSTGFESFVLNDGEHERQHYPWPHPYWSACAGGSGWDELRISKKEMDRVLGEYFEIFGKCADASCTEPPIGATMLCEAHLKESR